LFLGIGSTIFAASSTVPIVVKEKTIEEKYDAIKIDKEALDLLVSKYAMLYDGCKNK